MIILSHKRLTSKKLSTTRESAWYESHQVNRQGQDHRREM